MQHLSDRFSVIDAIHEWCRVIDNCDWGAMRELLTETIHIDYSSNGSVAGQLTSEEWIERLQALHGFDATLHMVTNLCPDVQGDAATCTSYVNAMHFLDDGDQELHAFACGTYLHQLVRCDGRWKISGATFKLAGRHGGRDAFDAAFARARFLAASRASQ